MSLKTVYLCTLPQIVQEKIKKQLVLFFSNEGFSSEKIIEEIEIAMNGRLCDCPVNVID